jgi:hypothetical protein
MPAVFLATSYSSHAWHPYRPSCRHYRFAAAVSTRTIRLQSTESRVRRRATLLGR